ncbi:hypothetical protein [Novosphingobium aquimarinum]|uniref:hypothetical protein n=1 Tax=Novosphingobium aquimarinum TaxID=2682494 RepID=UPI0012EB6720|nr:hypothetical protein [Novosphingobium aquimarinum]
MRASGSAIQLLVTGVIGLGVGPTLTGILSDRLAASVFSGGDYAKQCAGPAQALQQACAHAASEGLTDALTISLSVYLLAALVYLIATRFTAPR